MAFSSRSLKSTMHVNKFTRWTVDQRVADRVRTTCFRHFLEIKNDDQIKQNMVLITALVSFYNVELECFEFEETMEDGSLKKFFIDFGLQDILHITGLPIDGMQVSGYDSKDAIGEIARHLNISRDIASTLLVNKTNKKCNDINLESLREKFQNVPPNISEQELQAYVKAFILYLLGLVLLPNNSNSVPPMYLPLLQLEEIDNYAWGAAVSATLKHSMGSGKQLLNGFTYALMVFAFERFSCLHNFEKPSGFPLFLEWEKIASPECRRRKKIKSVDNYKNLLSNMKEHEVTWCPYDRLDPLPSQSLISQKWMIYSYVPCICFEKIAKNRADICFQQLALEEHELRRGFPIYSHRPKCNQRKSQNKDKNWRNIKGFYRDCNDWWSKRNLYIVKSGLEVEGQLLNYPELPEGSQEEDFEVSQAREEEQEVATVRNEEGTSHHETGTNERTSHANDLVSYQSLDNETPSGRDSSMKNGTARNQDGHNTVASQCKNENVEGGDILPSSNDGGTSNAEPDSLSTGEERSVKITPTADVPKESEENGTLIVNGNKDSVTFSCTANGSISVKSSPTLAAAPVAISLPCPSNLDDAVLVSKKDTMNDFLESGGGMEVGDPISPNSCNAVNAPKYQPTADNSRAVYDMNDLTKGEEKVKISWVNNTTDDIPPSFHYIPRNLVFRDAYVNISLSRIGNEDCCSTCMGNCVLSSKPCFCANKTGGDFAYCAQGLLKEEFLEECIAISRDPQNYFYCKECPLESSKNDDCLEPCKGHLKRKFIKECWSKCGCGKHCGNRIVQRGITRNLQVFLTPDGKGWGLRTLEDLPKGAFVCEFVGEILTIKELHERNLKYSKNGKYRYPVLLDADWDSGVVKDNQALCLFAASYGNAARFINHRCLDANLIEIPVEVEGPSHHYYHFAFFTSRTIAAQEELTWDYGINFDDNDQSVELFRCRCGSKFCRDMKRSSRISRSIAG